MTSLDAPSQIMASERYSRVAITLHWTIAAFIILNLSVGFFMEDMPLPVRFFVTPLHISAGITVLVLTLVRIYWRLTHRPPEMPQDLAAWERSLARIVHFGLYVLMLALPLSGWALISANPPLGSVVAVEQERQYEIARRTDPQARRPFASGTARLWWVMPLPAIAPVAQIGSEFSGVERQKELHDDLVEAHELGGYAMLVLLLLHVGGALKHRFAGDTDVLSRMGIAKRVKAGNG